MSEFTRGQLVVVQDPEIRDEYLAKIVRKIRPGTHARNPIVEILRILRYPIQRAVLWTDVSDEHPPLHEGDIVRMPVARAPREDDLRFSTYAESFSAAISAAMTAASGEELAILWRHAGGQFRGRGAILHYARWQLWQP